MDVDVDVGMDVGVDVGVDVDMDVDVGVDAGLDVDAWGWPSGRVAVLGWRAGVGTPRRRLPIGRLSGHEVSGISMRMRFMKSRFSREVSRVRPALGIWDGSTPEFGTAVCADSRLCTQVEISHGDSLTMEGRAINQAEALWSTALWNQCQGGARILQILAHQRVARRRGDAEVRDTSGEEAVRRTAKRLSLCWRLFRKSPRAL